jgi:hypothetical protein
VKRKLMGMTTTDYVISASLILLVIPQIRGVRQTLHHTLLPLVAVAAATAYYLKSFPTQGHDLGLDIAGGVAGAVLGVACGAATRLSRASDGIAFARAGALAALLWIVGMASRAGFEYWATHGGSGSLARFSQDNLITGSAAWTAALLLMALAQVLGRLAVIRVRSSRVATAG